jgi:N-acetylmuramoyl-L-alanine amidase
MNFITIHNTGNASTGAGARNHARYVKSDTAANLPVSWHFTVDERDIIQHLPVNEDAFHAGDGAGNGNRQSIGIEIAMNSDGDLLRATDKAAELTAYLCGKHNIPVENIVQHHHWNRKHCPQMLRTGRPYTWDVFIGKVREFMADAAPAPTPPTPPANRQLFRVQVGAFSVRANAEAMLTRVRAAGFADAFITTQN